MKQQVKIILVLSLGILLLSFNDFTSTNSSSSIYSLFKIERSKDANQIFYDVNLDRSGILNHKNPISVYWRRNTEGGIIKPLTWIQKKYAYGLKFFHVNEDYATFRFVCYSKLNFTLKKVSENHYEVYTKMNDHLIELNRIYIQIDGGSFWFPNISEIKIFAKDVKTGKEVLEVIKP